MRGRQGAQRMFSLDYRRKRAAELYLQGWSQAEIARELRVSQATVSEDMRVIKTMWQKSAVRDFDELRTIELQRVDRLHREAWAAWIRSQEPASQTVVSTAEGKNRASKSVKNQYGDPRLLELVQKCIVHRRALLGLDPQPAVNLIPEQLDGTATLEVRRERILTILHAIGQRERIAGIGEESSDSDARLAGPCDQPGALEVTNASESAGPDAVVGH